jgi:hypothetical protein
MASLLNPTVTHIVTLEYLFRLLLSEQPRPPARWNARGLLLESCIPGTAGHWLLPKKSGYGSVPSRGKRLGSQVPCTGYGPTTPS